MVRHKEKKKRNTPLIISSSYKERGDFLCLKNDIDSCFLLFNFNVGYLIFSEQQLLNLIIEKMIVYHQGRIHIGIQA